MNRTLISLALGTPLALGSLLTLGTALPLSASEVQPSRAQVAHTFEVGNGDFLLDGKPYRLMAGELHYERIPREYWEHRIQMVKALGMNAICIYTFWNAIEQEEGKYDFTGQHDVAEFVRLCQKHGLWVIVRPGPYCCAEWDMGGLPWWLLREEADNPGAEVALRSLDPRFMQAVGRFERALAKQLTPLTIQNGGPILMLQVENEFGSYGTDKPYVAAVRDSLRAAGWDQTVMFQCDWSSNFEQNALPDLVWTMNFGTNANVLDQFKRLKELRPESPQMCSEYWSGWFDGWGRAHETRPADAMVNGIQTMLDNGISFSLYMAHGGTSFGQWAGSNTPGYKPDCTSYDYDAPIDEQGAATDKYFRLRELLSGYSEQGEKLPEGKKRRLANVPKAKPVMRIPKIEFKEMAPFFNGLPEGISSRKVQTMEQFGQGWGSVLYTTQIPATTAPSLLQITEVHDYALVYVNKALVGKLYRGNKENALRLPALPQGGEMEILVEGMGRINYGRTINDRKGITEKVELLTEDAQGNDLVIGLRNWTIRPLNTVAYDWARTRPYAAIDLLSGSSQSALTRTVSLAPQRDRAGYYRATFKLNKTADTYLDLSGWGKGMVWINGHNIGRFWQIGPQQTLFVPGAWLHKGENEIIVLDIVGPEREVSANGRPLGGYPAVEGLDRPIVDQLRPESIASEALSIEHQNTQQGQPSVEFGNDAAPGARTEE